MNIGGEEHSIHVSLSPIVDMTHTFEVILEDSCIKLNPHIHPAMLYYNTTIKN